MTYRTIARLLPPALCALAVMLAAADSARGQGTELKVVTTDFYEIHTDLPTEGVQETVLRTTHMAWEYQSRTAEFSRKTGKRLPFYLFQNQDDYHRAGGMVGTGGVFVVRGMDKKLMAFAGPELTDRTWHTVQHEGFHQFADAAIGDLPTWANEGLAEYFGEGVWTGDGFVFGVITPDRLADVQAGIKGKAFRPLPQMLQVTLQQWNAEMKSENYDQAWAMSHFLAHADDGRYTKAFVRFLLGINKRQPWEKAWLAAFGPVGDFEKVWADWWLRQTPTSTADLRTRATLCTLASFAARAHAAKALPPDLTGLARAVVAEELKFAGHLWLPPSLMARAAAEMAEDESKFSLVPGEKGQPPKVLAVRPDGARLTANLPTRVSLPVKIAVDVDDLVPVADRAEGMIKNGKTKEAKALLADAVKRNPKSPAAERAKKLMAGLR